MILRLKTKERKGNNSRKKKKKEESKRRMKNEKWNNERKKDLERSHAHARARVVSFILRWDNFLHV